MLQVFSTFSLLSTYLTSTVTLPLNPPKSSMSKCRQQTTLCMASTMERLFLSITLMILNVQLTLTGTEHSVCQTLMRTAHL